MSKRHKIKKQFSLSLVKGLSIIDVNTTNWTDQTPEGLANFVQITIPDWKQLILTKNTFVIDPQKKEGDKTVSQKSASLKIGRIGCGTLGMTVDQDLTVSGKIPLHLRQFFGEYQK